MEVSYHTHTQLLVTYMYVLFQGSLQKMAYSRCFIFENSIAWMALPTKIGRNRNMYGKSSHFVYANV